VSAECENSTATGPGRPCFQLVSEPGPATGVANLLKSLGRTWPGRGFESHHADQFPITATPKRMRSVSWGGWTTAKVLLDVYGHFLRAENTGYALSLPTGALMRAQTPGCEHRPGRRCRKSNWFGVVR
jgi:hypothetical protein